MSRSEQSAEAVVAADRERRAERVEVHEDVPMSRAMRQMPERSGRDGEACGEAAREASSDEARGPRHDAEGTGSGTLLAAALTRENLQRAWQRVKANKGSAGVDGLDIEQTGQYLTTAWPDLRARLLRGDVPACSGTAGDDPEAGRGPARAGDPDGDGPADPAGAVAGAATAARSHLQRAQLRLPAGAACARRGIGRAVVRAVRASGGCRRGPGEVLGSTGSTTTS